MPTSSSSSRARYLGAGAAQPAMHSQPFGQVVAARPERVDVRAGVLEDHRDSSRPHCAERAGLELEKIDAVQEHLAS